MVRGFGAYLVRDRLRAVRTAFVAVAVVAASQLFLLPPGAQAGTFTINTQIGNGYCAGSKMTFDYSVENVDYPGIPTIQLIENAGVALELNVSTGGIASGAYSTNLPIGSAYTLQFKVDGNDIGAQKSGLVKNCLPPVRDFDPTPPSFNDGEGSLNDMVTVPTYEGVDYFINGQPAQAGTWPAQNTVTVLAKVATGYQFNGPQERTWTHTFTGQTPATTPKYNYPTPTVTFEKYHARKVPTAYRKYCAKLVAIRDDDYDGQDPTKRLYKALRTRCKLPFPRIKYSTRTTKVYDGIAYSWGVRPLTTGQVKMKLDDGKVFVLGVPGPVTAVPPAWEEYVLDQSGRFKGYSWGSGTTGYLSNYRFYQGRRLLVDQLVDQRMPYRAIPNEVVDLQIVQKFCNDADNAATTVTVGLKTHRRNPQILAEDTIDLKPGECRNAVVSDSAGLPPTHDEYLAPAESKERAWVHINPDKQGSLKYRSEKKGIYYYRINTDTPEGLYYQRSVLIGVRGLSSGETKPHMDARWKKSSKNRLPSRGW